MQDHILQFTFPKTIPSLTIRPNKMSGLIWIQTVYSWKKFSKNMILKKISADDKTLEILPSMQRIKSTNCKVNLGLIVEDWTCDFVCGTMSRAMSSLHWSLIHYQVTYEWHSGRGYSDHKRRNDENIITFIWENRKCRYSAKISDSENPDDKFNKTYN